MKTAFKVSLGGIVAALSVVLMFLTNVIPFGTFAFPALAGILLCVLVIELGYVWAFSAYAAVCVLSFFILTDKEAALYYTIFLGVYPILKSFFERIRSAFLQYFVKLLVFNVSMTGAFFISITVLSVPKENFTVFGFYVPWLFLISGNFVFILYDICVTKLVTVYLNKWHKKIRKNTKL